MLLAVVPLVAFRAGSAQAPGKWPPDSLVNTRVIARGTSVTAVWGQMRNISAALGVSCTFCHVGADGAELADIDYVSDRKRTKQVAREMLRLVAEVNRRLDSLPQRSESAVAVTCRTCHRGVTRPVPLANLVAEAAMASGADSALRAYADLRRRYYGRDAYDFGEGALNTAALRVARAGRTPDAMALLRFNESLFPDASSPHLTRGNVLLIIGDTTAAATAFREAIRRDPSDSEARSRLRDIGRIP